VLRRNAIRIANLADSDVSLLILDR